MSFLSRLESKLEGLVRLRRARAQGSPEPDKGFPQKGKPLKMVESYPDGSLFNCDRDRTPIKESIEELEKKHSLIIVRLKKKPEIDLA